MTMQIFIATYRHKHGGDVRPFASAAQAETWRQEIAAEYWSSVMKGEPPADARDAADAYFDRSAGIGDEWFDVTEAEMEAPPADPVREAAPAMLAALKTVLADFGEDWEGETRDVVRAAIAAAKGRAGA